MTEKSGHEIEVKVLFFGSARDATGAEEVTITTPFPASVISVKEAVFSTYQAVLPFAKSLMVAVNREYATDETVVNNLDEVAFLPPVSGG